MLNEFDSEVSLQTLKEQLLLHNIHSAFQVIGPSITQEGNEYTPHEVLIIALGDRSGIIPRLKAQDEFYKMKDLINSFIKESFSEDEIKMWGGPINPYEIQPIFINNYFYIIVSLRP